MPCVSPLIMAFALMLMNTLISTASTPCSFACAVDKSTKRVTRSIVF